VPEPIRARYVVIGGGAVGGALAAQLAPIGRSRGYDVVLVARGEHGRLVREQGLLVHRPDGTEAVGLDVVADSHGLDLRVGDVLLLTVKAQDAEAALATWAWQPVHDSSGAVVGSAADLPIVTYQNGLATEDLALRRFSRVYGATIAIPTSYLTAGAIVSPSRPPVVGAVWLGRHPGGSDDLQDVLVADLVAVGLAAWSVPDSAAHKATKLLFNVTNGLDLLSGSDAERAAARRALRDESVAVLAAAGVRLTDSGDLDHHGVRLSIEPVPGDTVGRFSSTWQSFARGASSETDYLNGEVVLLARRAGVEAPVNERLQRLLGAAHHRDDRTLASLLGAVRDDVAV
jgi:2-dehydropantoate 2-reductase